MLTIVEYAEDLFYRVLGVEDDRAKTNEGLPSNLLEKWLEKVKAGLKVK